MRRVFIDTWGWYSFISEREPRHKEVKDLLSSFLVAPDVELYTSHAVIAETLGGAKHRGVRFKRGETDLVKLAKKLQEMIHNEDFEFLLADQKDVDSAIGYYAKFCDQMLSYVDCLTIAFCKRLSIGEVVSEDKDFERVNVNLTSLPGPRR